MHAVRLGSGERGCGQGEPVGFWVAHGKEDDALVLERKPSDAIRRTRASEWTDTVWIFAGRFVTIQGEENIVLFKVRCGLSMFTAFFFRFFCGPRIENFARVSWTLSLLGSCRCTSAFFWRETDHSLRRHRTVGTMF